MRFPMGAAVILWLGITHSAGAFTLTPMSVSFEPTGSASTQSFTIENNGEEKIAVDVYVASREMSEDGKEENRRTPEIEKRFLVYPPQLLMKPRERRTVRVSWVGGDVEGKELAFRLVAEQLPVQIERRKKDKGATINMLLRYVGALYITPKDAKPELKMTGARPVTGKKRQLEISFENRGTQHQVLKGIHLKLKSERGGGEVTLAPAQLEKINGQNVLAGGTRKFALAWPEALPFGPIRASFELKD